MYWRAPEDDDGAAREKDVLASVVGAPELPLAKLPREFGCTLLRRESSPLRLVRVAFVVEAAFATALVAEEALLVLVAAFCDDDSRDRRRCSCSCCC